MSQSSGSKKATPSAARTAVAGVALVVLGSALASLVSDRVQEATLGGPVAEAQGGRAAAGQGGRSRPQPAKNALRVLFIGNSYTYVNDLPRMLGQLADSAKVKRPLYTESETPGGFTLQRHVTSKRAIERIETGRWDVVVLQDQSQLPSFSDRQVERKVYPFARTLSAAAGKADAKTVFFLTWGRKDGDTANVRTDTFERMQARLDRGYGRIARELEAPVAPVGRAWRLAVQARPTVELWSGDGSHPSVAGTYLAACVFFEVLYAKSVLLNPFRPPGVSQADAEFIQEMAHRGNADWEAKGWDPTRK